MCLNVLSLVSREIVIICSYHFHVSVCVQDLVVMTGTWPAFRAMVRWCTFTVYKQCVTV